MRECVRVCVRVHLALPAASSGLSPPLPLLLLCRASLTLVYWCASCVSNGYEIVFAPSTLSALCNVKCNQHTMKTPITHCTDLI